MCQINIAVADGHKMMHDGWRAIPKAQTRGVNSKSSLGFTAKLSKTRAPSSNDTPLAEINFQEPMTVSFCYPICVETLSDILDEKDNFQNGHHGNHNGCKIGAIFLF